MTYIMISLLVGACSIKEGILAGSESGNLFVSESNDLKAEIYLNGISTGLTTPSAVNAPIGHHEIALILNGYEVSSQNIHLHEGDTTNVSITLNSSPSGTMNVDVPDGGHVVINGINYKDKESISLAAGTYTAKLHRGNYSYEDQVVEVVSDGSVDVDFGSPTYNQGLLIENFSNVFCGPCPTADSIIVHILEEYHDEEYLVHISYHSRVPNSNDPIYIQERVGPNERIKYYGSNTAPHVRLNGTDMGTNAVLELNLETNMSSIVAAADIGAAMVFTDVVKNDSIISGVLKVESLMSDLLSSGSNQKLRLMIGEKNVVYEEPPGDNGMSHFENIYRYFYPDYQGMAEGADVHGDLFPIQENNIVSVPFSFDLTTSPLDLLPSSGLYLAAYIQDDDTKKVIQTVRLDL